MAPAKVNQAKTRKACNAMKPFGITAATVKTALKDLLKVYENNWRYIEEDNFKMLLDAILEPESPKKMEIVEHGFKFPDEHEDEEEEEEETEPLKRKPRLRSQASSSTPAGYLCEYEEKPLGLEYKNMGNEVNKNDENENRNDNIPPSPCSEIDVAASLHGEVKLTFNICKPPPGFHIPNLDAVIKHVEDTYQEKFHGLGTAFSISQLLKDICQCFMEQGNASDHVGNKFPSFDNFMEQSGPSNDPIKIPSFVVSSETDHCVNGKLRNQQMVGLDELSGSSSLTLTIIPNEHYCVADITRGLEKQKISLVNEVDDEKVPKFSYIQKNVNYKAANVKFLLARISHENSCTDCVGDCLSSEVPCACAVETGGEFAYTTDGFVDEKFLKNCIDKKDYFYCDDCPLERIKRKRKRTNHSESGSCKGHLVRKFIKECWYKCGCDFNCGNRVVQRGIKAKLQVFMTPEGKGWGLRTLEDLPRGAFVCEYAGEIVTNGELFERNEEIKNEQHAYTVLLDADWSSEGFLKDEKALCLDATRFGNAARFINHRCVDANMVVIPVEVESPDHHYYHHALFTTREVKAMEELTWDYGIDFDDDSHPVKAFPCKCGSKSCKAVKRYKRSRRGQRQTPDCRDIVVVNDKQLIAGI